MAPDRYRYFRVEARELIDQLGQGFLALERSGADAELVARLLRAAHTLKGAARVVKLPEMAEETHAIEELLSPLREGGAAGGAVERSLVDALLAAVDRLDAALKALDGPAGASPGAAASSPGLVVPPSGPPGPSGPSGPSGP
ncbi:MAG TPA: Hpt domain-containing protein, partial [Kofleriaceae bacterium]|nr:Hpt domain-containing protein [Kofleriaceae bacterium]